MLPDSEDLRGRASAADGSRRQASILPFDFPDLLLLRFEPPRALPPGLLTVTTTIGGVGSEVLSDVARCLTPGEGCVGLLLESPETMALFTANALRTRFDKIYGLVHIMRTRTPREVTVENEQSEHARSRDGDPNFHGIRIRFSTLNKVISRQNNVDLLNRVAGIPYNCFGESAAASVNVRCRHGT